MQKSNTRTSNVRWRTVALPTEHGGWGFISEPVILGMLLAPGWAGLTLSIAAFAAFLLRQPLRLYLKDLRAGRRVPRTLAARRFVLIYGGVMSAAGVLTLLFAPTLYFALPLLLALPLLMTQLAADLRSRSRSLPAEVLGATAPGAIASAIVLLHDWSLLPALGLWLALALKAITAVLYVRARLRLERGQESMRGVAITAHIAASIIMLTVVSFGLLPWTAVVAIGLLTLRAALGLSTLRKARRPQTIGIQEIGHGLAFVLLVGLGYLLNA